MKKKRQSYCRRQRRVSPLPSSSPSFDLTPRATFKTADVLEPETQTNDQRTIYSPAGHVSSGQSWSISRDDDDNVIDDVSRISRLSPRHQAPGAQCSTNELGLSMGPLHSTMDYPQYSTPDGQRTVSRIDNYNAERHGKRQILKANNRLSPLGEERVKRAVVRPPGGAFINYRVYSKDANAKKVESRDQPETMTCFSKRPTHMTRKSRTLSSKAKVDITSYRTVSRALHKSRDSTAYCSLAVNAGSWIDVTAGQRIAQNNRSRRLDLSGQSNLSCCTEHDRNSSPEQVRDNVTSSGTGFNSNMSAKRENGSKICHSHYASINHGTDRFLSRRSNDSFFGSPMPIGRRPPCIGKEWSPNVTTDRSVSRSSNRYQSKRDYLIVKCNKNDSSPSCGQECLNTDLTKSDFILPSFSLDDWTTLAVF
ncbi:hypothetical protein LSH36_11g12011 [Paralvinella palmiformis]|uniref:Uncharacterized protein n=1 Tax=Paralvinella palmiformis TaxID=53620 RepID=A0AAD9KCW3_9ANNE|nr:hypothetical protein LSH36_11g12011 [Paralvinella palmiformis]